MCVTAALIMNVVYLCTSIYGARMSMIQIATCSCLQSKKALACRMYNRIIRFLVVESRNECYVTKHMHV